MKRYRNLWNVGLTFVIALLLSVLSGCSFKTPTVNLYSLTPTPEGKPAPTAGQPFTTMTMIMPVHLAPQLNQSGMLMQVTPQRTQVSTFHLWSAPLDKHITAILSEDLSRQLHTVNIAIYPGPRYGAFVYSVEVDIQQFSAQDETFTLQANWTINDIVSKKMLKRAAFAKTLTVSMKGYDGYVQSASDALSLLSYEIAETLRTIDNSTLQDNIL